MTAPLPDESVKDIVRSSSEACVKAIEFDIKISDDKLQYSAWVLAAATAGFAIAITQSDKLISSSAFVGEQQENGWLRLALYYLLLPQLLEAL